LKEPNYGDLAEHEDAIRTHIKAHFNGLKEKQIKDLLDSRTWLTQLQIMRKAERLQQVVGHEQHDDMNGYESAIKAACSMQGIKLEAKEKNLFQTITRLWVV